MGSRRGGDEKMTEPGVGGKEKGKEREGGEGRS
jgi:hypothetical protein